MAGRIEDKLDAAMKDMWLKKPEDIHRMVGRNYDTGKEFSVWAYTWGFLSNLSDLLNTVHVRAKAGEGDVATLATLMADMCRNYANSFNHNSHMYDCEALLNESADAFEKVETPEELATLTRALQRYVIQLSFWVDMELPWAKVSELVDAEWHKES